ncbi:MAG: histidinol-phosphatase HisJ family protein [Oscillospiraceae bacterium]|nr:histidinol-phosphatase HisJ family protein [Oscillospiraceae bacterium]
MYLADYHVHSACSTDGHYPMFRMAEAAAAHGLDELCFTDHLDTIYWDTYSPRSEFDWEETARQIEEARARWGDRLAIKLGAELGESAVSFDRAEKLLSDAPELDFIIGSVHLMGPRHNREDIYYIPKADEAFYHDVIDDYLDDVMAVARWGKFQVLGHLTLPVRYIWDNAGIKMDFSAHMDRVEEIFREIIPRGIGIECNTNRGAIPLPDESVLRLYRQLGGEIITIGSDAHSPDYVGCRVAETQELLRQCGFRYFATFTRGKPEFRPL